MNTLQPFTSRADWELRSENAPSRAFRTLVAVLGLAGATAAAQAGGGGAIRPTEIDDAYGGQAESTPWVPQEIEQGYVLDPTFAGGKFKAVGLNALGAPNPNADFAGRVTALLSDGDTVVAGLTPPFGENNQGNGLWNLGLVRFGADGGQKPWPNPGSYGNGWNVTVIYPGSATSRIQYVRDVKVWNGFIYVLADYQTEAAGLGRQDVRTYVFREDGSYVHDLGAFGYGLSDQDIEDFYGTALVPINADRMMMVATAYNSVGPYAVVNRQTIQHGGAAEGTLGWDTSWGDPYAGSALNRIKRYYGSDGNCFQPSDCPTAEYAFKPVGFDFEDFYIAGSMQDGEEGDWDVYVLKISSQDGATKPEFGLNGWVYAAFDEPGSNKKDLARGLYVYRDDVYLAASVERQCHPGIGMMKLNGATGDYVAAFGNNGKIVFGGQGSSPLCLGLVDDDVPFAISATPNRIGVAGYHAFNGGIGGGATVYNPMLAVVDATSGQVLDLDSHPVVGDSGNRIGDAVLYDLFGGNGVSFTVAGDARYASVGNRVNFLSGRFVPVSGDRIFADGFGTTLSD